MLTDKQLNIMRKQAVVAGFSVPQAAFLIGMFTSVLDAMKIVMDEGTACPKCGSLDTEPEVKSK